MEGGERWHHPGLLWTTASGYVRGSTPLSFAREETALISSHPAAINGNGDFLQTLKPKILSSAPRSPVRRADMTPPPFYMVCLWLTEVAGLGYWWSLE